ncbi:MAG TPA: hypothetical protein PK819_10975 [Thermomicrobiales bacterium]|nr:hypothetical protein [Thermomicrobiales bacterium]
MLSNAVIIALIPGCVEIAKRSGLPNRFAPLAAIAIGILLGGLSAVAESSVTSTPMVIATIILTGLINGLAAIGLYRVFPTDRIPQ